MHVHHPSSAAVRALAFILAFALFAPHLLGAQTPATDTTRAPHADSASQRSDTAAHRLAPVTVTVAPAEQTAPVSAVHVSAAAIRQTPARNPYDLLRQTAGVEVHEQGQGPGFASDASLRGFSSDHATDLALWIDGVPVNEPVNGHSEGYNDWNVLFPGGVQDIDVIRGPTSALFGNFALAGVVNVRTLERMRGTEVTASGGSFGRAEAMVLTGFDHGARGGGVIGARFQREDGFRPNSGYDISQGHARVVHDLTSSTRIDGGVELYGGDWRSPGFLSEDEFTRGQYDVVSNPTDGGSKRRAQERVSLRVLEGNLLWRSTVYATQSRWQLFLTIPPAGGQFEGTGSQTEEIDDRHGYGATTALTLFHGRGDVTVGGESRWDDSHYRNWFSTARQRDSVQALVTGQQLSGALFVQSSTRLGERLRLDAGARLDALRTRSLPAEDAPASDTHGIFSPKVGAIYQMAAAVSAFANVSRGFRSPDGIIMDPSLALITEWSYEGGVKLARGGVSASATLFRSDVSNEQTFNPVTLETTAGGASRRQGLELDWRIPLPSPRAMVAAFSGDWTFNDARYRSLTAVAEDGGGPAQVLDGLRVFNTSKYVGLSALDLGAASGRWLLRADAVFNGPYSPFDEPGVVLPGYGFLNLSGQLQAGRTELDAGIRNVFSRRYPEVVAGGLYSPGEPRMFRLTVRVRT